MPIVERGALRIDFTDSGQGPPVVLAHSSVSGNRQWRRLAEALSPHLRVLAPNLRGYGQTSPASVGAASPTLDESADVLLALCEDLGAPIRLVGHSWGGAVALQAAHRLGPRVSRLVLYEPMLFGLLRGHGHPAAAEAQALYDDVQRLGGSGDWLALAARFTDYFNGEGAWAVTAPERRQAVADALPPNVLEWRASAPPITADAFAGIRADVLLMQGGATREVMRATAMLLSAAHPHWHFERQPDWGHMGPLTHADAFNRRVAAFLLEA